MKIKGMILVTLLLVILTVGAVSAADGNVAKSNLTVDEDSAASSSGNMDYMAAPNQENSLSTSGTLNDLQNEVNNAGDELNLTRDYICDVEASIEITKKITINGNGFTIDCKNMYGGFEVNSEGVVFKNIKFINSYNSGNVASIIWYGNNGVVSNCTFVSCSSQGSGSAIGWEGSNGVVSNCSFIDCSADDGGAIYWMGSNGHVDDCSFQDCSARKDGGAIYWDYEANYGVVSNCIFLRCHSQSNIARGGGAIYWGGEDGLVSNSSFSVCYADTECSGGAIFWDGANGKVENSNFTKSYAGNARAIYANDEAGKLKITNSRFENNGATSIKNLVVGVTLSNYTFIEQADPKIIVSVEDNENKGKEIYTIVLPADATGTLEIFIDGSSIAVFDIINGIAKIDLSKYKDGNYVITYKYSGDSNYFAFTDEIILTNYKENPKISANNLNALYTGGKKYSASVLDKNGNYISGTQVIFKISGKQVAKVNTNIRGQASFKVNNVPGKYKVTIMALGISVKKTLNVKHLLTLKTATVKKSSKKLILQASLAKVNKKYLKNKKVTFKFNGKKYTAKTDKKGVAKVTIKSSVLNKLKVGKKVTYQATYLKDTVKKTSKVKK